MQNFSSSSFLLGFSCLSFMHNTNWTMVGILPESINQSFLLAYSTKMKAITQGKVLIRLASSISTPLKSPEGLNDLQTDFDFFWSAVLRLTRCSLYYRLRWRHTSRKAAANWKRTKPRILAGERTRGLLDVWACPRPIYVELFISVPWPNKNENLGS